MKRKPKTFILPYHAGVQVQEGGGLDLQASTIKRDTGFWYFISEDSVDLMNSRFGGGRKLKHYCQWREWSHFLFGVVWVRTVPTGSCWHTWSPDGGAVWQSLGTFRKWSLTGGIGSQGRWVAFEASQLYSTFCSVFTSYLWIHQLPEPEAMPSPPWWTDSLWNCEPK